MAVMSDSQPPRVDRTLRFLLVDDDAVDRAAVRRALQQAGLTVEITEAADQDAAHAALTDAAYDCLIVDYLIPGSGAQQVIDLATSLGSTAPAIVLTGHGDEMVAVELLKRGAADYLPKSQVANGQLVRSVLQALRDASGQRVGRVTLQGGVFLEPLLGSAMLGKFARMAVVALENGALLRAAKVASEARVEVLSVVSHDLRSPLGTVSMGAAMLRRSITSPGGRLADDLEIVNRISRSCKRMERLIEDLLDASRLDSGNVAVTPRPMPAADLVQDALDAATLEAAAGKVKVVAGEVAPLRVMADRDRVLQVFSNLVGNALKFTPAEGTVSLAVEPAGDFARFTVTDSGAGFPAEYLPRLFDRFWKGDRSGRHSAGLGLYIARGIVIAHGGQISAESEPGRGTTFAFTLPLSP
jgi:signal transduction histidine kinase